MQLISWTAHFHFLFDPSGIKKTREVDVYFNNPVYCHGSDAAVYVNKLLIWDGPVKQFPSENYAELLALEAYDHPKHYPDSFIEP